MKQLLNFVLKQKLAIYIMTIIIMVFGIYSTSNMNEESLPNVDIPYLIVTTVYPGGTPEQINDEISAPLEKKLKSMEGLLNIDSQSMNNFNLMVLEYDYGTDLVNAKAQLQKELDKLELAENVQEPSILEISMNSMPVATESITSDKYDTEKLSAIIEKELLPKLEEIEGVSEVTVNGLLEEEIQVTFNEELLKQYNLTTEQLLEIVKANNTNMPIGIIDFDNAKEAVTVVGEKTTLEDFENALLPFPNATQDGFMKLKDFATFKEVTIDNGISRVNGKDSLTVSITKTQSGNTVNVVNDMNKVIDKFKEDYKGIDFVNILDQAEPIETAVETMLSKALFGALAAIVIIMIFLRDVRSTVISIVSIPLSLLMALAVLHQIGVTLNTMTLAAMTVAIGRVIDDSIVVVENIYRRLSNKEEKLTGRALISASTIQMFLPILSSTLVTIAVFLPLMLVGGMVGEIFMPFALSMMFSLLASLLVAVTVVPALAHTMFKKELYDGKQLKKHKESSKLNDVYKKGLIYTLNHKAITIICSIVLVLASGYGLTQVKLGFLPSEVANEWTISYTPANDELDSDIEEVLTKVEKLLLDEKDVKKVQATYSQANSNDMMSMMSGSSASVTASFDDIDNIDKYKEELLKDIQALGGKGVWEDSMAASMSMNSNQISYSVYGETLEDIEKVVTPLTEKLSKVKGLKDVESDLNEVYKEHLFVVDEEKLAANGLTTAQVGMVLYNMSSDTVVSTVTKGDKNVDIVIKAQEKPTNNVDDLLNRVAGVNPVTNQPVMVKDVVKVEEGTTVNSVTTNNGYLVATVTGTITTDSVSEVNKDIQKIIDKVELPLGTSIDAGGVTEQMTDAFIQLALAMLAAIAIVYLLLVLTFREGLAPFVILFSLPMTIIGVVVALLVTGVTLDISGMLGLLMLIGIVVTNAIVLIDRVLENEYAGKDIREAIIEAGVTRLRPILMTAIATMAALIPLAIGAEGGGLISQGLGIVVIGGLFSSTILTLFIVPVLYELLSKLFKKDRKNIRQD